MNRHHSVLFERPGLAVGAHPSRRRFMQGMAGLGLATAGGALWVGCRDGATSATTRDEPPPETTRLNLNLRINPTPLCGAAVLVADDLLRDEGFTEVLRTKREGETKSVAALASGEEDIGGMFAATSIFRLEAGDPIVVLAGLHTGCFQVVASDAVRSLRDLKGKTIAVAELGNFQHVFTAIMLSHIGLDPQKDVQYVKHPPAEGKQLLAEGKVDAYLGFPPDPQELRARGIGHVLVNSMTDRPWSQYFCCMVVGNREFVRKHPVATKRVLRAYMKASDLASREPERVARLVVDKGYTENYDYALETMKDVSYAKWRQYDPEDTLRFYALRLHEAGWLKNDPKKIIAGGTNWSFLRELKKELKA
jgi:NitT/TauT family transport system substrate-binding protein